MQIDVGELRKHKSSSEDFQGNMPDYTLEIDGQEIYFRDLVVEGNVTNTGEALFVRGKITGELGLICSRCLKDYNSALYASFDDNFYREGEDIPQEMEEELSRFYSGERIDLTESIKEALQLALPMKPVCTPECKGLCSICGCDLNHEQCACKKEKIDPRLAVLGQLMDDQNKNSK